MSLLKESTELLGLVEVLVEETAQKLSTLCMVGTSEIGLVGPLRQSTSVCLTGDDVGSLLVRPALE